MSRGSSRGGPTTERNGWSGTARGVVLLLFPLVCGCSTTHYDYWKEYVLGVEVVEDATGVPVVGARISVLDGRPGGRPQTAQTDAEGRARVRLTYGGGRRVDRFAGVSYHDDGTPYFPEAFEVTVKAPGFGDVGFHLATTQFSRAAGTDEDAWTDCIRLQREP